MRFLVLMLLAAPCHAEEPVEIPLSEIWGFAIPGTTPVQELEPNFDTRIWPVLEGQKRSAVERLRNELNPRGRKGLPRPALLVSGEGKEALEAIDRVLAKKQKPLNFPISGDKATFFFFVESQSAEVLLHLVKLDGYRLIIECELIGKRGLSGPRFALIPLTLPDAEFLSVEIKLTTSEGDGPDRYPVARSCVDRVCESRKFTLYPRKGD